MFSVCSLTAEHLLGKYLVSLPVQNLTYEIILTLGQAFEVAYQLALQAQRTKPHHNVPVGLGSDVIETKSSRPVPKPRGSVRKSAVSEMDISIRHHISDTCDIKQHPLYSWLCCVQVLLEVPGQYCRFSGQCMSNCYGIKPSTHWTNVRTFLSNSCFSHNFADVDLSRGVWLLK